MSLSATPIRVGLIGYGYSGRTFHAPLITAVSGLALCAVASSDPKKVHVDLPEMTVYADPLALATADGIDLVVIATPNASHAQLRGRRSMLVSMLSSTSHSHSTLSRRAT